MNGADLIAAERERQIIEEGFDVEDDVARQPHQQLAVAAWCYLGAYVHDGDSPPPEEEPAKWPWPAGANGCLWKPTPDDPIRQLVKAGALIAAEIDRLKQPPRQPAKKNCPDDGRCHHDCPGSSCFRVQHCGPLSGVYPGDQWPPDVLRSHPAPPRSVESDMVTEGGR